MYKIPGIIIITLCLVSLCTFMMGQVVIQNPSLEGPLGPGPPNPWVNCNGSPDMQPGIGCNNLPPSDGNTYLGIGSLFTFNGIEQVGQLLGTPLLKNFTYRISVDLSQIASTVPNCGGGQSRFGQF